MKLNSSSSSPSKSVAKEKEILDQAARLAAYAIQAKIAPSQINNMLEFLNSLSEDSVSLLYITAYVLKQGAKRNYTNFAKIFKNVMIDFYNKKYGKTEAIRLLGVMKWLVEALKGFKIKKIENPEQIKDFESLMKIFDKQR